ncbi:hypothetical protein L195_g063105, partial [Trifolium pratense]
RCFGQLSGGGLGCFGQLSCGIATTVCCFCAQFWTFPA